MSEWILEPMPRSDYPSLSDPQTEHLDGVPWFEAPIPRWLHRCRAQTRGYIGLNLIERCACGAIRRNRDRFWMERNSSKGHQRDVPSESFITRKQRQVDEREAEQARKELDRELAAFGELVEEEPG